jgi:hypothetical protein
MIKRQQMINLLNVFSCEDYFWTEVDKSRMLGVPVYGRANVFCDNNGVVKKQIQVSHNATEKHSAISNHE